MTRRLNCLVLLLVVALAPFVLIACEEKEDVRIHREEHRAPRTVRQEEVVVP